VSKRIYERADLAGVPNVAAQPEQWTAIIPAAGKGSRLGYGKPKILYPILGRPIARWLVDALRPSCARFVFVVSPDTRDEIDAALAEALPVPDYRLVVQDEPRGMADAIDRARGCVSTPHSIVIWGDQVTLSPETVRDCIRIHLSADDTVATVPTISRQHPYIHFVRGGDGRIVEVLEAREGARMPAAGENDCGVFLFATDRLFDVLRTARSERVGVGTVTNEFSLVPLLPLFDRQPGRVVTARIIGEDETVGVNTPEDAAAAERILAARTGWAHS